MSISYRKLNIEVSADKESVLLFGQELSTKYFTEVVVVTMLNAAGNNQGVTNGILNEIHAAGLNAGDYGIYSRHWANAMNEARQDAERRRIEAEQHAQRIADENASPEEVAKYRQEQERKRNELANRFGRKGAAFGPQ